MNKYKVNLMNNKESLEKFIIFNRNNELENNLIEAMKF